jgi:hypothetical protein
MNRVGERDSSAPAESDDAVLLLRGGQGHSVLCDGVELSLNPYRIERSNGRNRERGENTVWHVRKILHGEQIWRDRDKTIGG